MESRDVTVNFRDFEPKTQSMQEFVSEALLMSILRKIKRVCQDESYWSPKEIPELIKVFNIDAEIARWTNIPKSISISAVWISHICLIIQNLLQVQICTSFCRLLDVPLFIHFDEVEYLLEHFNPVNKTSPGISLFFSPLHSNKTKF